MLQGGYDMNAAAGDADLMNPLALALQHSFGGGMPHGGARMWDPTSGTWVVNPNFAPLDPTQMPQDPAQAQPPGGVNTFNPTLPPAAPGTMTPGYIPADGSDMPSPITTGMGFPGGEPRMADPTMPPAPDPNAPMMDTSQPPPWMQTLLQQVQASQQAQQPQPSASAQPNDPNGPTLPAINGPVQGLPPVAAVGSPPTPDAYMQAITASMQPYFDESQKQLAAQLAAQGILTSGAGNKQFQDLTARNNATIAGMQAPLIQQGFGQQFSANTQNAGAYNQALMQMLAQSFAAQQQNANLGLQGNEFNASLINDAINRNTGYANQALGQGAGYGNADYLNALAQQAGFMGTNLGSLGYILGQGMNNQLNSYLGGQQTGNQYANQIGQNQGYQQSNPNQNGAFNYYGTPAYQPYNTFVNTSPSAPSVNSVPPLPVGGVAFPPTGFPAPKPSSGGDSMGGMGMGSGH